MCAIILPFNMCKRFNLIQAKHTQAHSLLRSGFPHFDEHDFSSFILFNHCLLLSLYSFFFCFILWCSFCRVVLHQSVRWIDTIHAKLHTLLPEKVLHDVLDTMIVLSLTRAHAYSRHRHHHHHRRQQRTSTGLCSGIQFNAFVYILGPQWHPSNRQNWYDLQHTFSPVCSLHCSLVHCSSFYIHGWLRNRWMYIYTPFGLKY